MKTLRFALAFGLGLGASIVKAEEQEWRQLHACVKLHQESVARVVVSLQEGADLLAGSLCSNESVAVMNEMIRRPEMKGISDSATRSLFVIKKELKAILYQQKKTQN